MKNIPRPNLSGAVILTPLEMNKIHFGGNQTPLTPDKLKELADKVRESGEAP